MKKFYLLTFSLLLMASAFAQEPKSSSDATLKPIDEAVQLIVEPSAPLPIAEAKAKPSPVATVALAAQPALDAATLSGTAAQAAETASAGAENVDANLKVARAEPVGDRELATRLQIFLDQAHFGPGKIDGRSKEFTLKALARYQKAHGLPVTGLLEDANKLPLDSIYPIYITYTIQESDLKLVGDSPRKPEQQAKLKKLLYPDLLTFLEERFHCDPEFLRKINHGKDLDQLVPGDEVRVPNVEPFKIETVREIGKLPVVAKYKTRRIQIDTKEKMLDLLEGDQIVASFPITPGSEKLPAPSGTWRILGIATLPWFRHDEGVLNHGVRTSNFFNLPAGPRNPVGVVWIGLNRPGIGIHGTNQPLTIGRSGSHGCIRLANWDAIRLVAMITEGMTVIIDDGIPRPRPVEMAAKKDSSNAPLTASPDKANKSTPQIPGRETNYANH